VRLLKPVGSAGLLDRLLRVVRCENGFDVGIGKI